jgi:hypothetical protein
MPETLQTGWVLVRAQRLLSTRRYVAVVVSCNLAFLWFCSCFFGVSCPVPQVRPVPLEQRMQGFDVAHPGTRLMTMARPVYTACSQVRALLAGFVCVLLYCTSWLVFIPVCGLRIDVITTPARPRLRPFETPSAADCNRPRHVCVR